MQWTRANLTDGLSARRPYKRGDQFVADNPYTRECPKAGRFLDEIACEWEERASRRRQEVQDD